jgi:RNA 3'-terminal phosphate cyclase (ATP)
MLTIDGSEGEGGGQMLRSSLSLAICTQQPVRLINIRANRQPPGLKRQHLTAAKAAAEICDGALDGAHLGSHELVFRPGRVRPGRYSFAIGTAGSTTLVLQTVLPPLMLASEASHVRISGGTHNRGSPPFDFLERAFVPLLQRIGAHVHLTLASHGFYPRGGGELRADIGARTSFQPLSLHDRGVALGLYAEAYVAALPLDIAQRELATIGRLLDIAPDHLHVRPLHNEEGPGNAVTITAAHEHVTEVFAGFGERGVRAERVAEGAAHEARAWLSHRAPVGEHLADQLLLPLALAAGGSFTTTLVTEHLRTNAQIVERFTDRRIHMEPTDDGTRVTVS